MISLARGHLLIIGLTAINYAMMLVYSIPELLSAADGLWPFDLRIMGYSVEDATQYMTTITPQGNRMNVRCRVSEEGNHCSSLPFYA